VAELQGRRSRPSIRSWLTAAGASIPRGVLCQRGRHTLMHHLVLGITPATIAVSPYVAVSRDPMQVRASELGPRCPMRMSTSCRLIGAYVGADNPGGDPGDRHGPDG